jgi:hypothetical protein
MIWCNHHLHVLPRSSHPFIPSSFSVLVAKSEPTVKEWFDSAQSWRSSPFQPSHNWPWNNKARKCHACQINSARFQSEVTEVCNPAIHPLKAPILRPDELNNRLWEVWSWPIIYSIEALRHMKILNKNQSMHGQCNFDCFFISVLVISPVITPTIQFSYNYS